MFDADSHMLGFWWPLLMENYEIVRDFSWH